MKKIISIVLTVFVFISCLMSLSVSAEDLTYNFVFKRSNGTSDFAITASSGVTTEFYNDYNNTRSLQDVATSLKADESATALYSKYQNMVDAWAQGVGFAN